MTHETLAAVALASLPAVGADLEGGIFAGLTTTSEGQHAAIVLLPAKGQDLTWKKAGEWAAEQGGVLPTRPVAALLYANVRKQLEPRWHWTSEEESASYAWICYFGLGYQGYGHESYEGCAVAVRLIRLSA